MITTHSGYEYFCCSLGKHLEGFSITRYGEAKSCALPPVSVSGYCCHDNLCSYKTIMTGRKSGKAAKKRAAKRQQDQQQPQQQAAQTLPGIIPDEPVPNGIRKEQPSPQQVVKKILKAENDEARTLKVVFKSNPDTQMKDFIKKAAKPPQPTTKQLPKTPADAHPPAVAQDLLETDDEVADNLCRMFKASKSMKNL